MTLFQKNSTARVQFIFFTILLDAISVGLLIPVLPDVLKRFSLSGAEVSEYFGYFLGLFSLMQFVASPILGALSDRYGRRPVLLISLLGAGLDYLLMAFAPNLTILFLGRIISGLTGANLTVASSYMADISDDSNRSANFGLIGAAFGVGFIAGPLLGGVLSHLGPQAPFIGAAILNLLNFFFGVFVLPESLSLTNRRKSQLRHLNPFVSIFRVLKPSPYVVLIYIYFMIFLAGQVHPVNWTLYSELKFGWSSWQVGLSLSFVGVMLAIVQGGLTRVIIPKLGEKRAFTLGLCIYVLGFFLFGIAPEGWMMYPIIILFAFSGVTIPSLQSIVSRQIPPHQQGELQGSLVSLGSLAAIIAPLLFTKLFSNFTDPQSFMGTHFYFPGIAYVTAAFICLLALTLDLFYHRQKRQ